MTLKQNFITAVTLMILTGFSGTALAQSMQSMQDNPYLDDIRSNAETLAKNLNEQQVDDLSKLREAFGIVESIKIVRERIGKAVTGCSDAHADMSTDLSTRYTEWKDHVNPVIQTKEKTIKDKIFDEKRFDKPQAIWDYLMLINKAADHANEQRQLEIVTTQEACDGLYKSMTDTKTQITDVLERVEFP